MPQEAIIDELTQRLTSSSTSPAEIVFSISMGDLLAAIAKRMGKASLTLNATDLLQARDEVRAVIDHCLDQREYISMGLDVWELIKTHN